MYATLASRITCSGILFRTKEKTGFICANRNGQTSDTAGHDASWKTPETGKPFGTKHKECRSDLDGNRILICDAFKSKEKKAEMPLILSVVSVYLCWSWLAMQSPHLLFEKIHQRKQVELETILWSDRSSETDSYRQTIDFFDISDQIQ